jgi:hypothetical protein
MRLGAPEGCLPGGGGKRVYDTSHAGDGAATCLVEIQHPLKVSVKLVIVNSEAGTKLDCLS